MDSNNKDRWVEDRIAELRPASDWQPDTVRGLAQFRRQRDQDRNRNRRWIWLAAGAVAAGLPLVAFPTTRVFAQRCVSACVSQTTWVRSLFAGKLADAAPSTGYVNAADRKTAPDFVLDDTPGKPVRLSEFRGKVVLLNFWATWCAPCRIEIPWFIEFQKTYQNAGFVALGVSLDEDGWDAVKPFADQRKINYPLMIGNDELAQRYGADSLPTTLIIDKAGRIAATHVGLCSKGEYEAEIKAVLSER